jgi:hypothetical protein
VRRRGGEGVANYLSYESLIITWQNGLGKMRASARRWLTKKKAFIF